MKTPIVALLFAMASVATLPAAVTISTTMLVPNGSASGGTGSAGTTSLTTSSGSISVATTGDPANVVLPVSTYTVTGVDLTSVGGGASESFTFTVTYTATTDGSTAGTVAFSGFGNVAVTGGVGSNWVDNTETLTATVALTDSSFAGLSLTGFTKVVLGAFDSGDAGAVIHGGGTTSLVTSPSLVNIYTISGSSFILDPEGESSEFSLQGFDVQFEAVPEPTSAALLALGAVVLLRRRRSA